jgi:hypothetical protein
MAFTGWLYKQTHNITSVTTITNYQVQFTIYKTTGTSTGSSIYCNNHCNDDFSDIRFSVDGVTSLSYWIESYTSGVSAVVWVKVPSISDTTIWIYYGNESASTTSNGDDTFVFFDDFETGSISSTKWPTGYDTYTASTSGAYADYSISRVGTQSLLQSQTLETLSLHTIEFNVKFNETNKYHFPLFSNGYLLVAHSDGYWALYNGSSYVLFTTYAANTWYKVKIVLNKSINTYYIYIDSALIGTVTNNTYFNDSAPNVFSCYNVDSGQSAGTYLDNIFIHKYATIEPTHVSWSEEQEVTTSYPLRITITPTSGTDPLSVSYNLSISETLDDFVLNFGDGQEYTGDDITSFATTHTYNTPGTYTVWAEGYNEFATHVYYEIPYGVTVNSQSVTADLAYNQLNDTVTFHDESTGNPSEWFWTFGDGTWSYTQNPIHTYPNTGIYHGTLHASNQYQYDNTTFDITVITVDIDQSKFYICPVLKIELVPHTVTFRVRYTGRSLDGYTLSYTWDFNDGTTESTSSTSISHTYTATGVYYPTCTIYVNEVEINTITGSTILLNIPSKTLYEKMSITDHRDTFYVQILLEYLGMVDVHAPAIILHEKLGMIQRKFREHMGIDEFGHHVTDRITSFGHSIHGMLTGFGRKITKVAQLNQRGFTTCDFIVLEETITLEHDIESISEFAT